MHFIDNLSHYWIWNDLVSWCHQTCAAGICRHKATMKRTRWGYAMETLSALLALCENTRHQFPSQRASNAELWSIFYIYICFIWHIQTRGTFSYIQHISTYNIQTISYTHISINIYTYDSQPWLLAWTSCWTNRWVAGDAKSHGVHRYGLGSLVITPSAAQLAISGDRTL